MHEACPTNTFQTSSNHSLKPKLLQGQFDFSQQKLCASPYQYTNLPERPTHLDTVVPCISLSSPLCVPSDNAQVGIISVERVMSSWTSKVSCSMSTCGGWSATPLRSPHTLASKSTPRSSMFLSYPSPSRSCVSKKSEAQAALTQTGRHLQNLLFHLLRDLQLLRQSPQMPPDKSYSRLRTVHSPSVTDRSD